VTGQARSAANGQRLVVPYDPAWPEQFAIIRATIQRWLAGTYYSFEHVGSTAVPGMVAKPVIDIDIVIPAENWEGVKIGLESLGYVHKDDQGIEGREAFELRDEGLKSVLAAHHLYVCAAGSPELKRHLAFRDYLIAHPEAAQRLSEHKLALAARHGGDREAYIEGKAAMVEEILAEALKEADER
jgi:GrpB-like predicted nucleotidyltransferase (UPF0157 family)